MTSGMRKGAVGVALALGVLTAAPAVRGRAQETPPTLVPPTLEQRVLYLEAVAAAQDEEIARLNRLCAGLVDGSARMAAAAEQALIKGFVEAGANPDARTELLNGLSGFADAVRTAAEPPKKEVPAKK